MQSKSQRPTSRHHYLPEFYLKRWAGANGKLFEFTRRERRGVVSRSTAPGGTGWQTDLYKAEGMPPEVAYAFEERFFAPVDSLAAETLGLLERHGEQYRYTIHHRRAWSRFVVSLLTRLPEDVSSLKQHWRDTMMDISREDSDEYAAVRSSSDPASFADYIASEHPGFLDGPMFQTLAEIIDGGRASEDLATIHWTILTAPIGMTHFLTSDRPLLWSARFGSTEGNMAIPIGPRRLFIAARDPAFVERLKGRTTVEELIRYINEHVVQAAKRFVYAYDERQARFIQNRLGTKAGPSVVEQAIARRLEKTAR